MGFINVKKKEVQIKVVYYGPGRGGKTTNLEYINEKFRERIKTEMVSIKTHGDRTLFLTFCPLISVRFMVLTLKFNSIRFLGR